MGEWLARPTVWQAWGSPAGVPVTPHPALSRWEREKGTGVSVVSEKTYPCEPLPLGGRGEGEGGRWAARIDWLRKTQ
jgi:hypothetical protein